MPRKGSLKGRRPKSSLMSQTYINLEKANKRIKGLRQHGDLGTYASKDIMRMVSQNKHVKFNKKGKLTLTKPKGLTFAETRLINKRLKEFNKAKTGTHGGIEEVREETKKKMKETLSGMTDRDISDKDAEFLYSLFEFEGNFKLFEAIPESDVVIILNYAKEENKTFEDFWEALKRYADLTNQSDLRQEAFHLYITYKYKYS